LSRITKLPLVLLNTKGARSGLERTVSVNGFADGDDAWLVVASNGGSATHPAWFKNMVMHPDDICLEVGREKVRVRGDLLTGAEREEAFGRIAKITSSYSGYRTKTDREIPVVRLTRVSV
jgi:deazaflavin-dependent oxidoreductase (nitroreductase family)